MLASQQLYETNNIAKGNGVVNMRTYVTYSYIAKDGAIGSSTSYPNKYEGKFKSLVKSTSVQSDFAEGYRLTSLLKKGFDKQNRITKNKLI